MSTIKSELADFSEVEFIEDGRSLSFSWDKKSFSENHLDLKDFAVFFKVKNFYDFSSILPNEYEKYKKEELRIRNWISTFSSLSPLYLDAFNPFPPHIASLYLSAQNRLLAAWMEQIRNEHIYSAWMDYYLDHRESFDLLKKMAYPILTTNGEEYVDLEFAENFRFKAKEGSVNLFHMPKEKRETIISSDDHFLYMVDFRQFEFRTFLMLASAPVNYNNEDLYGHIGKRLNLANPKLDIISYLYSQRVDKNISTLIDKDKIMFNMKQSSFLWRHYPVFFREDSDHNKKIHTIIQTISYFIYLEKFTKILRLLENKKSKFVFPLHDAMIFSISVDEAEDLLEKIPDILTDEIYKIKQYVGKDLYNMEML